MDEMGDIPSADDTIRKLLALGALVAPGSGCSRAIMASAGNEALLHFLRFLYSHCDGGSIDVLCGKDGKDVQLVTAYLLAAGEVERVNRAMRRAGVLTSLQVCIGAFGDHAILVAMDVGHRAAAVGFMDRDVIRDSSFHLIAPNLSEFLTKARELQQ